MSTKITLDDPTGSDQWITDLGITVANGDSVQIDDPELAASLLQNPIWKGRRPRKASDPAEGEDTTIEDVVVNHADDEGA